MYTAACLLSNLPAVLYYLWPGQIMQYLYLIGVPIITAKLELSKFEHTKKIDVSDVIIYMLLIAVVILSIRDLHFTEIFVWQIALGVLGICIVASKEDGKIEENKFLKYWSLITYMGTIVFFLWLRGNLLN